MQKMTPMEKLAAGLYFQVPAYLDVVQPELTQAAIDAAEDELGVKLPEVYLALLRTQNGGYLRATWPATYSRMIWGLGATAPSLTRNTLRFGRDGENGKGWVPKRAEGLVPFDGEEAWVMCFDYRVRGRDAEPSITLVDRECEFEEPVASTFTAFLAGLVDTLADSTRLYGEVTAEAVARALSQELRAPMPRLAASSLGFASYRIALRGDHQWCWVSDNRVPAGFRRDAATGRVRTTAEQALQLPEDPRCAVLLSCTEDVRARADVSRALTALGLT